MGCALANACWWPSVTIKSQPEKERVKLFQCFCETYGHQSILFYICPQPPFLHAASRATTIECSKSSLILQISKLRLMTHLWFLKCLKCNPPPPPARLVGIGKKDLLTFNRYSGKTDVKLEELNSNSVLLIDFSV